jgi:hypothetical protein
MSTAQTKPSPVNSGSGKPIARGSGGAKGRNRKVYEHEMSSIERHAFNQVQQVENACQALKIRIREGKKIDPRMVETCMDFNKIAVFMLFGD